MAIESLGTFIGEQLQRDGLTVSERRFLVAQKKAADREIKRARKLREEMEGARALGRKLNEVWGGDPDETPLNQFTEVMDMNPNQLLEVMLTEGDSRIPLVRFNHGLTRGEKAQIGTPFRALSNSLQGEDGRPPTLRDLRRASLEDLADIRNIGKGRRLELVDAARQLKPQ